MKDTLIILAELSFHFGFIDYNEFKERIEVALWLSDETESVSDPRNIENEECSEKNDMESNELTSSLSKEIDNDNWLEFLFCNTWVFTKSDPDSYPSTPHGHYKSQNNKWPKLNPYTGRAFKAKHQEDQSKRLNKKQMKKLWSDKIFRSFCREYIVWYMEEFPYHRFSVRNPLLLPRW